MVKKEKYQITSSQKKKKKHINCSMTTMNNMRLYLSIIILKQMKKRESKEDMEEQ